MEGLVFKDTENNLEAWQANIQTDLKSSYQQKLELVVGLVAWRVSLYFDTSFSPMFSSYGAIINTYLTYQRLLWKYEKIRHATKPTRSV